MTKLTRRERSAINKERWATQHATKRKGAWKTRTGRSESRVLPIREYDALVMEMEERLRKMPSGTDYDRMWKDWSASLRAKGIDVKESEKRSRDKYDRDSGYGDGGND